MVAWSRLKHYISDMNMFLQFPETHPAHVDIINKLALLYGEQVNSKFASFFYGQNKFTVYQQFIHRKDWMLQNLCKSMLMAISVFCLHKRQDCVCALLLLFVCFFFLCMAYIQEAY